MKKSFANAALTALLLAGLAGPVAAYPITSVITGADMVGIEVQTFFNNASSETAVWAATSQDAGEATGSGWSLQQQGQTFGDFDGTNFIGLWTFFNNTAFAVNGFSLRGLPGRIVFDTVPVEEETPGSDVGRPFITDYDSGPVTATYSDPFSAPDLFGTLNVSFVDQNSIDGLASGTQMRFFADTDAVVPAPASLALFGAGLIALVGIRRRRAL